jgi:predicted chitinase
MTINRKFFFSQVREHLFGGRMTVPQVGGMTAILDHWENGYAAKDDRWLAYMLATVFHETGRRMQPVRETYADSDEQAISRLDAAFRNGRLPWVSAPYWNKDANGQSWYGRGLVQITHRANYVKLGNAIGVNLTANPDRTLDMDVSVKIMFVGMEKGLFTAKKLADYFHPEREDWRQARRIINGLDKAELIAGYGRLFYAAISHTT